MEETNTKVLVIDEQGSQGWFDARIGKLTASRFGGLLTRPRSKKDKEAGLVSKTTETYLREKVTEVLTGETRQLSSEALTWGSETENDAREFYELNKLVEVEQVGFISWKENLMVGGSPDGLVGLDGIIEIKCPYDSTNHTVYLYNKEIPKAYYAQIQGNLFITDRKWCDFIVYNPRVIDDKYKMIVIRIERDEEFIKKLKEVIGISLNNLEEMLKVVDLTFKDVLERKYVK